MESEIKGKVVAITGASSGIGEAIGVLLAKQGAKVVLGARRSNRLEELVKRINADGGEGVYMVTDVRKKEDLTELVKLACTTYGKLDVIVNNAGISQLSRMDELDIEGWEEMIDVNLKGTLYGIAAALPVFKTQGFGHVINIISTSGIKIVPMQAVYAGTKNAVRTITEALRQESIANLRVTGISPGFVQSELAEGMKDEKMKSAIKEKAAQIAIPPSAIASAVVFAIGQPTCVDVGDIVIRPTAQD